MRPDACTEIFRQASARLSAKLRAIDIASLGVSPYTIKYFTSYLGKLEYALESISLLLREGVGEKQPDELTLIDHGGGIGIISFLAAEAGFNKVIYFDIYDLAAVDAERLAKALDIHSIIFSSGQLSDLKELMVFKGLSANLLVSRNVIEHIYDLDEFFEEINALPSNDLRVAFSTTANKANPLTNIYTRRMQIKIEKKGLAGTWNKQRDSKEAYLTTRKKIIAERLPTLRASEVDTLAARTRGYVKEDILNACDAFKATGKFPEPISDPFNTCDPLTGNWTERLMPLRYYRDLFSRHGFTFEVIAGTYNKHYKQLPLKMLSMLLNPLISAFGKKGYVMSPYIILKGRKK